MIEGSYLVYDIIMTYSCALASYFADLTFDLDPVTFRANFKTIQGRPTTKYNLYNMYNEIRFGRAGASLNTSTLSTFLGEAPTYLISKNKLSMSAFAYFASQGQGHTQLSKRKREF